ncbi:hypothetical protein CMU94_02165 [Elizabethkingia anophelis]|nr:hypothetical protein [Elizabethkingia anophelis]
METVYFIIAILASIFVGYSIKQLKLEIELHKQKAISFSEKEKHILYIINLKSENRKIAYELERLTIDSKTELYSKNKEIKKLKSENENLIRNILYNK